MVSYARETSWLDMLKIKIDQDTKNFKDIVKKKDLDLKQLVKSKTCNNLKLNKMRNLTTYQIYAARVCENL